jgi:DDE superfamily endonuclease
VPGLEDRQIKYLSNLHEGKKHDKKICDEEGITFPAGSVLYRDTGFQGHDLPEVTIHQPQKKPRGGALTEAGKEQNRLISGARVVVEHVIAGIKRCRIVKDIFRNTADGYDDQVMELVCGLHNYRSYHRLDAY